MELRGPGELFGYRQSGSLDAGLGAMAGDTAMLKITHDEAREILRDPDAETARTIMQLARETYADRLNDIAMN